MNVIGLHASPRRNGNTETLVRAVLRGAESQGAQVRLVSLYDLKMNGCLGCEGCKKDLGRCVQKDDLSPILAELGGYDAVVLGTPVYWWHVNGRFKMLTDRFYCYFREEADPATGEVRYETAFPAGKKFVVVTSRGDEEKAQLFPELYGYLSEWLKMLTAVMGASRTEFIHQYGSGNDKDAARKDASLMARAEAVGASLVTTTA
jgi:multimeric flavodoxin WrbA